MFGLIMITSNSCLNGKNAEILLINPIAQTL